MSDRLNEELQKVLAQLDLYDATEGQSKFDAPDAIYGLRIMREVIDGLNAELKELRVQNRIMTTVTEIEKKSQRPIFGSKRWKA